MGSLLALKRSCRHTPEPRLFAVILHIITVVEDGTDTDNVNGDTL